MAKKKPNVTALVEAAMKDPEGATKEGRAASTELERLAWCMGWTERQTALAETWAEVGQMALGKPPVSEASPPQPTSLPMSKLMREQGAERTGKQLAIYLPPDLYARLDASARRNHRTKTVQVVLALEAFLAADEAAAGIDGKAPTLPQDAGVGTASQPPGEGQGKRQRGKGAKSKGKG